MTDVTRTQWAEALISGVYTQGEGALRKPGAFNEFEDGDGPDGFCCLGVLADLIDPNGWDDAPQPGTTHLAWHHDFRSMLDAHVLVEVLDVDMDTAIDVQGHLAHFNDTGGTFQQVAEVLLAHDTQSAWAMWVDAERNEEEN